MERIGERIKRKREIIGLQLNELAKKVGISSSALSQIEKAKAFPTIITLKHIAQSLHTTVGELIGENETENNPLIRKDEIISLGINDFGAEMYQVSHHELNKLMDTFMIKFPKDSNSMGLFGKNAGQIYAYVSEGELQFEIDHQTYNLEKGDHVYFNARRNFRFLNVSGKKAELVCVASFQNV